ncbi:hypothetical protein BB560_000375 [Smittium megazygosporum]|uniref:Uncharacterized protein n=1 Tax=Smittium megazygosporum TaxID=133381 RepID=A0A2T9ZKM9_9FUNG|nr:hypothetical protein BB560_000375 [Smittium megazygosporum]
MGSAVEEPGASPKFSGLTNSMCFRILWNGLTFKKDLPTKETDRVRGNIDALKPGSKESAAFASFFVNETKNTEFFENAVES